MAAMGRMPEPFTREDAMPDTLDRSDDVADAMREAVRSGEYPSEAAIVAEALETWRTNRVLDALDPIWLRRMYDEGVASGIDGPLDMDAIMAEMRHLALAARRG